MGDAKTTIHIDSDNDDDVELVDDDDDDVEIVEPNDQNDEEGAEEEEAFVITDSEDENFEVIVEPEAQGADAEEAVVNEADEDVHMISDLSESEDEIIDEEEVPVGHLHMGQQHYQHHHQRQQQGGEQHNEPIEISDTESEDEGDFIITNTLNDNGRTTPIVIL